MSHKSSANPIAKIFTAIMYYPRKLKLASVEIDSVMANQEILQPASESEYEEANSRPPLGSWKRLYWAVLGHLAFWIITLYAFTAYFD